MHQKHADDPLLSDIRSIKNITKADAHRVHEFLDNIEREIDGKAATMPDDSGDIGVRLPTSLYTGTIRPLEEIKAMPEAAQFQYYRDLPMSGVFAHARQNLAGNAREVIGGLAKFVTLTILPEFVLWKDKWKSEKRALWDGIGMLAAGALYEGLQSLREDAEARDTEMWERLGLEPPKRTMHVHRGGAGEGNTAYYHLLDYPPLKKFMKKPSTLFNAVVNMYKNNWGWGSWGEVGIKRYLAEQPLDLLADLSIILAWVAQGTATVTKAGSLALKSAQLQQLRYGKFYQSRIQRYVPIDYPQLNKIFKTAEDRFGKAADNLEWMSDQAKFIGTGMHGTYPPGYWAKMANIIINYMDVGAAPFLFGGQMIGGVALIGGTTRQQVAADLARTGRGPEYHEAARVADEITVELFEKYGDKEMLPEEIIEHYRSNYLMYDPLDKTTNASHAWRMHQRTLEDWAKLEVGISSHIANTRNPYVAGQRTIEHLNKLSQRGITNILSKYPDLDLTKIQATSGFNRTWKYYFNWLDKHESKRTYPNQYTETHEVLDFPLDAFKDMGRNLFFKFSANETLNKTAKALSDLEKEIDGIFAYPTLNIKKYEELTQEEAKLNRWLREGTENLTTKFTLDDMRRVQQIVIDNMSKYHLENRPEFIEFVHRINLDLYENLEAAIRADKIPDILAPREYELLQDVIASKRFYESALQHANSTYNEVLLDGIAHLHEPEMAQNMGRVLLSNDIIPTDQISALMETLDESSQQVLRAITVRELFEKSRNWENVYIRKHRITEPQLPDSYDHELTSTLNNPIFPSSERHEFKNPDEYLEMERLYNEGDMQGVIDLLVKKEFENSRRGLYDEELMQGPQQPGTAYVVDRDEVDVSQLSEVQRKRFENAKLRDEKYLVFRTGAFVSGSPSSYRHFRHNTMSDNTPQEIHDDAVMAVVRSDNVIAYGLKQPLEEPIVRPQSIVNRIGLKKFDDYYLVDFYGDSKNVRQNIFDRPPWIPPTALRLQLDRVGAARLTELFGEDVTRDLYRYADAVETMPAFVEVENLTSQDLLKHAIDPNGRLKEELSSLSALLPLFGNGDPYLNYLELVFNLAGDSATLGFLGTAGGIETILRFVPESRRSAARTFLNDYRKWTSALLRATEEPEPQRRPMRTRVTAPVPSGTPGRSAMERLQ